MICEACSDGEHEQCEDTVRQEYFQRWLQSKPFGEDVVVGQDEMVVIKANRPYSSCPCQHKVKT